MRIPALPLIASVALFAAPAFAQTAGTPTNQPNAGFPPNAYAAPQHPGMANQQNPNLGGEQRHMRYPQPNQQAATEAPSSNQQTANEVSLDTQRALRQSLLSSGFRDVTVEPQTYVVHAQAPDGSHIVMLVGPEQVAGVVTGTAAQPNQAAQSGSSNWSRGGMNGAGTSAQPNGSAQNGPSNWNQGGAKR
jgi:hypothetical protein